MNVRSPMRWRFYVSVLLTLSLVFFIGCGTSEETLEETAPGEMGDAKSSDQQALTNIVGDARPTGQQPDDLPNSVLIEELKKENLSLKQRAAKLEQDSRSLASRLNEAEARAAAEKERADKAEASARTQPPLPKAPEVTERVSPPTAAASLAAYQEALAAFKKFKYDEAIQKFQALLSTGVTRELADNCNYWIGESRFGKKEYKEAITQFEKVLEYEASTKLADAHFMMGRSFEQLGDKAKAKAMYEKVVKDFPTSDNIKRAKEHIAKLR